MLINYIKENIDKKLNNLRNIGYDIEFLGMVEKKIIYSNQDKVILQCKKHNVTWNSSSYNNIMKDSYIGCPMCLLELKQLSKFTPEAAFNRVIAIPQKYDYDFSKNKTTFTKVHEKVTITCKKHGDFEINYETLLQGKGICPACRKENLIELNTVSIDLRLFQINEKIVALNKQGYNIEFLGFKDEKIDSRSKLILHCNIHNVTWNTTSLDNFLHSDGIFCPKCSEVSKKSNKELYCYNVLKNLVLSNDINTLYKIPVPKNIKMIINNITGFIYPDFYIPSINAIIEYDGEQHYRFIPYMQKTLQNFVNQVNRDNYLEKYCKEHEIRLLRIPWVDDKRIKEIIKAFIVEGKDLTTKVHPKLLPMTI